MTETARTSLFGLKLILGRPILALEDLTGSDGLCERPAHGHGTAKRSPNCQTRGIIAMNSNDRIRTLVHI